MGVSLQRDFFKMSLTLDKESLDKLKFFVDLCRTQPEILHQPEIKFFRDYIESLGGQIPEKKTMPSTTPEVPQEPERNEDIESEPESDLEIDNEGCIEPDVLEPDENIGDILKEATEEEIESADEKRREAMAQLSEGNAEKAVELFTEAIKLNPTALLYAKRGQAYLKLQKPNACIRDCTKALELNPDSAAAYKFRGRAYRLIGEWEKAAKDLRQACNIDFDEQTDEWLKEVTPNAKKIEQHRLKQERKKLEKEERARQERIRKAREAHAKAQSATADNASAGEMPKSDMGDFYKLLQDPEVMAAFQVRYV